MPGIVTFTLLALGYFEISLHILSLQLGSDTEANSWILLKLLVVLIGCKQQQQTFNLEPIALFGQNRSEVVPKARVLWDSPPMGTDAGWVSLTPSRGSLQPPPFWVLWWHVCADESSVKTRGPSGPLPAERPPCWHLTLWFQPLWSLLVSSSSLLAMDPLGSLPCLCSLDTLFMFPVLEMVTRMH